MASYSRSLAERVEAGLDEGRFVVVLGGDCSIVLGCLLGASQHAGRIGLAYVDAHADFAAPGESETGSVASMCLAFAVGHGDSLLARLAGSEPIVGAGDVALIGRRDASQPSYGHAALRTSGILDLPDPAFHQGAAPTTATAALARIGRDDLSGFWILVDADVLQSIRHVGRRIARTGRPDDRGAGGTHRPDGRPSEGTRDRADAV